MHPAHARSGVAVACGLGVAASWNIGNVGAIPSDIAQAYDVALVMVGLFTTALFVTHAGIQIPGGKAADRFGAARAGGAALLIICAGCLMAAIAPDPLLAIFARALTGIGTGLAFVAGSQLVRDSGGSTFAQGIFGGIGLSAAGVALAVVPQLEGSLGWRAPYWTALAVTVAVLALLIVTGVWRMPPSRRAPSPRGPASGILRDLRLYRLGLLYTVTYGLSVVIGNWVIELLERHSSLSPSMAALVGALTLLLMVVSRPVGGWIHRSHPHLTPLSVGGGLVAGALGTAFLLLAEPGWLAAIGGALVGMGAGMSFSPAFTGAADTRPDAPAAAVGVVNAIANFAILVGTPLVGLSFSGPGEGRLGFAICAALWLAGLFALPRAERKARPAG